ncbi:NADAR family protein [Frankia sp. AgW1.1]|nr:NADAR family protein [Frankia sp. AgW1.1]
MTAPTMNETTGEMFDAKWPTAIDEFRGEYEFLSNFARTPFQWGDRTYPTVEHAFQCMKTTDPHERERVVSAATPGEAKARGRQVTLRAGWDRNRLAVMEGAVRAKFSDPRLARMLAATGSLPLVEGNRHHDQFWGDCRCGRPDCARSGENQLGQILMRVRADLATQPVPAPAGRAGKDDDLSIPAPMLRLDPETRGRILDTIPARIRAMRTRLGLDETSTPDQVTTMQTLLMGRLEDVHETMRACAEALSEAKEALIRAQTDALDAYDKRVADDPTQRLTEFRLKHALNGWVQPEREDVRLCQLAYDYAEARSKLLTKQLTGCESLAKTVTAASGGYR